MMIRDNSFWKPGESAAVYCKKAPGMENAMQPWRVIQSCKHGKKDEIIEIRVAIWFKSRSSRVQAPQGLEDLE